MVQDWSYFIYFNFIDITNIRTHVTQIFRRANTVLNEKIRFHLERMTTPTTYINALVNLQTTTYRTKNPFSIYKRKTKRVTGQWNEIVKMIQMK